MIIKHAITVPLVKGPAVAMGPPRVQKLAGTPDPTAMPVVPAPAVSTDPSVVADRICDALGVERSHWLEMTERFDALVTALTNTARRAGPNGKARR